MIEAKKLAYADMLRYVGDPRVRAACRSPRCSSKDARGRARAGSSILREGACAVEPSRLAGDHRRRRAATRSTCRPSTATATSCRSSRATTRASAPGIVPPGRGLHAAQPRRAVHARARASRTRSRRASGRCTPSSRASWRRTSTRIGFGIMGGWNQAQAHAQFVAEHRRLRHDDPGGARGRPLHQEHASTAATCRSRRSCPEATRAALTALGHELDGRAAAHEHRSATARR